jgi:hypothetical protein
VPVKRWETDPSGTVAGELHLVSPSSAIVVEGEHSIPDRVRPVENMDGIVVHDAFGNEHRAGGR